MDDRELHELLENTQVSRRAAYLAHAAFLSCVDLAPSARAIEFGGANGVVARLLEPVVLEQAPPFPESDVTDLSQYSAATYDLVVLDEVLEHVTDPWRAVGEVERILRPGGWLLTSSPFLIAIHRCPEDYWRFSPAALRKLLSSFARVEFGSWGNRTIASAMLDDMMLTTAAARAIGVFDESNERRFPVTVWAYAQVR